MPDHPPSTELLRNQYNVLFDRVYRFIRARTYDNEETKDIVSDIFLKAIERINQFDEKKGTLEQWVMTITRHTLIDHWRTKRPTCELDETSNEILDLSPSVLTTIDSKLSFEEQIKTLSEPERILLRLRHVDEMTYEEIGVMYEKRPETMRQIFCRLHKKLRLSQETI